MIKNLVFDFGDVFINLDKGATQAAFRSAGIKKLPPQLKRINTVYEKGECTSHEFIEAYRSQFALEEKEIVRHWNAIIKDFPRYRLDFLQALRASGRYRLILLSNTNEIHIDHIKTQVPFYEEFKACFDDFYLSHEIGMRKPDTAIYEFVLDQHALKANGTLFIDDTVENTLAAEKLGIHTWNIDPATQDVVDLFSLKKELF